MLTILDGRKNFFQWDTEQKLIVSDELVKEIHFSNAVTNPALVCEVFEEDGNRVVNVPNILLQQDWNIKAYGCCDLCVRQYAEFEVIRRNKPADYVYTETEIKRYEDLEARIEELEKNGGGTGGGAVASVNGKVGEVVLNADDVGAVPTSRTVNGMSLSSNISISANTIGAVPLTRKINNKALSADISLTASDVGAVKKTGDTMTGTLTGTNINLGSSTSTAVNKLTITKKISDTQYINGSVSSNGSNLRVSNTLFTRSGSGSGYTSNTNNIDIGANNTTFSKPILLSTAAAKEDTRENLEVYSKAEVNALIPEPYTLPVATAETIGGVKIGEGLEMSGDVLRVKSGGEDSVPEELFCVTLAEMVTEIIAPLKHPAKHMYVLVYPPDDYDSTFMVYLHTANCEYLETGWIGDVSITDGTAVSLGTEKKRFMCKIDSDAGLVSAYWGVLPESYQSTNNYKFLNRPIRHINPEGISTIIIRSVVAGKEIPARATIKVIGV